MFFFGEKPTKSMLNQQNEKSKELGKMLVSFIKYMRVY